MATNQVQYPLSGKYKGTILISPAVLPDPEPIPQEQPNITSPILSSTGTRAETNKKTSPIPIPNLSFGVISVPAQTSLIASKYMSEVNLIPGTNITLTTNPINSSITINSTGSSVPSIVAGNSINVVTSNSSVTITNTMTETVYEGGNVSTTLTPDRNNGTIQKYTLTGNITLNPPTNVAIGQSLTLILTQDSSGNRLLDANTAYLFASGFQTLSTSSGAIDMLNIFSDGTTYYTTLTVEYS